MLASLFLGHVVSPFELFHTKDANDAYGLPPVYYTLQAAGTT